MNYENGLIDIDWENSTEDMDYVPEDFVEDMEGYEDYVKNTHEEMLQEVKEFLEFFQQKPDFGKPNPNNLNMEGLIMEEKLETGPVITALTIQACVPGFYLLGSTQYILGILHWIGGWAPEYGTFLCMDIMPMITPLISLYFIAPYNKVIVSWFSRRTTQVAATTNASQQSATSRKPDISLLS